MLVEDYLDLWSSREFSWDGGSTCAHYAGGWVRAQEGRDPLSALPVFSGRLAAGRVIADCGGFAEAVTQALGRAPLSTPRLAQVGDLVLLPGQFYGTLGICNGLRSAVLLEQGGIGFVDTETAEAAWRVAP